MGVCRLWGSAAYDRSMSDTERYTGQHRSNAGRHRELYGNRGLNLGHSPQHAAVPPGKHRANAGRHTTLGGYTPTHATTAKSHNKRSKASHREVKSRQPGLGTALKWVWDLGYR